MRELKPCPLCNGLNIIFSETSGNQHNPSNWYIYCKSCGIQLHAGDYATEEAKQPLIDRWNKR